MQKLKEVIRTNDFRGMLNAWVKVLVLLLLFALTILIPNSIDQYEISGDEFLINNRFEQKFNNWHVAGDVTIVKKKLQTVLQLKSDNNQKIISIKQTLGNIRKGQSVQFVSAMKISDVEQGNKAWKAARIIFVALDENGGSIYNVPHILIAKNGTSDWENISKVFVAISHAAEYYVEIQLVNVTGEMWVKDISLRPVEETQSYRNFQGIILFLWMGVLFWMLITYQHTIFASKWNFLIITMIVIALSGALVSADLKHSVMEVLKLVLPWVEEEESFFRVGHFLVYCMLSIIVFWKTESARQVIFSSLLIVLFAMATEILQFLVDGRTPRISDFYIDLSGIALGLFISLILSPYNKQLLKKEDK